jgi:hypothetical protein
MFRHPLRTLLALLAIVLLTGACNLPTSGSPAPNDIGAINTLAAQTVIAQLTQMVEATPTPGIATQVGQATSTQPAPATEVPTATPTASPTATNLPTNTPVPPTATSRPTATPLPCNWAQFVSDVTVPDNTTFTPGESFKKTWRLKNIGSCTWTTAYSMVFLNGESMNGSSVPMPRAVAPGETVDLSVNLVAPSATGTYRGNWMLRNKDGRFGIGDNANVAFWVQIKVGEVTSGELYNFAKNYCSADWASSKDDDLPCPGKGTEPSGFVVRLDNPELESRKENEPTLWTNPSMVTDGWITGTYPGVQIKTNDRLLVDVGCLKNADKCNVKFQINYRANGGALKSLGEWHEVYDGKMTRIDLDLSGLNGQSIEFVLTVLANGEYNEDAAFWLNPHIERGKGGGTEG